MELCMTSPTSAMLDANQIDQILEEVTQEDEEFGCLPICVTNISHSEGFAIETQLDSVSYGEDTNSSPDVIYLGEVNRNNNNNWLSPYESSLQEYRHEQVYADQQQPQQQNNMSDLCPSFQTSDTRLDPFYSMQQTFLRCSLCSFYATDFASLTIHMGIHMNLWQPCISSVCNYPMAHHHEVNYNHHNNYHNDLMNSNYLVNKNYFPNNNNNNNYLSHKNDHLNNKINHCLELNPAANNNNNNKSYLRKYDNYLSHNNKINNNNCLELHYEAAHNKSQLQKYEKHLNNNINNFLELNYETDNSKSHPQECQRKIGHVEQNDYNGQDVHDDNLSQKDQVEQEKECGSSLLYWCHRCSYTAKNMYEVLNHLKAEHEEEKKAFQCNFCEFSCRTEKYFNRHMLIHKDSQRRHACPYCPYKAKGLNHLRNHLRVHTGEKPFECPYDWCDYSAAQLVTLQIHVRRHTGQRPYSCIFCPYTGKQKGHLKKHVQNTHLVKD